MRLPAGQPSKANRPPDLAIFGTTMALLVIGMVMVFSASYTTALREFGDPYYYIKRQLLWGVLGVIAMVVLMRIDYRKLRPLALPGLLVAVLLLALVLVIGTEVQGSRRWISLGFLSFQPSELGKVATINFIAALIAYLQGRIARFWQGFVFPLFVTGIVCGLILVEPDLGTSVALAATVGMMLFVGGANLWHLGGVGILGVVGGAYLVVTEPYRMKRITSFIDPWADPLKSGWNIIQSLYAIGSGGLYGLGLGQSRQKFAYLPEQYTDFIFSILAEELGFFAAAAVVLLYFIFAWRGCRVALHAPDLYGSMLAMGITGMIVLQAFINIAVATASMPVTGITLPLISAGGSSLTVTLASIGVLLNISRAAQGRGGAPR